MRQPTSTEIRVNGFIVLGIGLGLGAAAGAIGLIYMKQHGLGITFLRWMATVVVTLMMGSLLCLLLPLSGRVRWKESHRLGHERRALGTDYVAKYPRSEHILVMFLVVFFLGATAFGFVRSSRKIYVVTSTTVLLFSIFGLLQVAITRIQFTPNQIIARLPYRRIEELYENVASVTIDAERLYICFSDGFRLKIHSRLGDLDWILSYLKQKCPPSTEYVSMEQMTS